MEQLGAVEGLDAMVKRTNFGALGLFPQGAGGTICSLVMVLYQSLQGEEGN